MKFALKNKTGENIVNLMRTAGYRFLSQDAKNEQLNFVRSIAGNFYPRFHVYLQENKATKEAFLNLHLDHKKPSYKGATAHSGEYEGGLLEKEAERIKQFFSQN